MINSIKIERFVHSFDFYLIQSSQNHSHYYTMAACWLLLCCVFLYSLHSLFVVALTADRPRLQCGPACCRQFSVYRLQSAAPVLQSDISRSEHAEQSAPVCSLEVKQTQPPSSKVREHLDGIATLPCYLTNI